MPVTDYDTYRAKRLAPNETVHFSRASITTITGRRSSLWTADPLAVAPSTAVAPTSLTAGALGQQNGGSLALRALLLELGCSETVDLCLCDRLSHQGGLSGNLGTLQATNLPTAALTRYTTGAGVQMGLEIYTVVGASPVTCSVVYTNQGGTGSQVSPAVLFGATGNREVGRFFDLPLAVGDTGVRSVESLTLSTGTGTAGNIGLTLYRQLLQLQVREGMLQTFNPLLALGGLMPEILDDACLFWIVRPTRTTSGVLAGQLGFAEDDT